MPENIIKVKVYCFVQKSPFYWPKLQFLHRQRRLLGHFSCKTRPSHGFRGWLTFEICPDLPHNCYIIGIVSNKEALSNPDYILFCMMDSQVYDSLKYITLPEHFPVRRLQLFSPPTVSKPNLANCDPRTECVWAYKLLRRVIFSNWRVSDLEM